MGRAASPARVGGAHRGGRAAPLTIGEDFFETKRWAP